MCVGVCEVGTGNEHVIPGRTWVATFPLNCRQGWVEVWVCAGRQTSAKWTTQDNYYLWETGLFKPTIKTEKIPWSFSEITRKVHLSRMRKRIYKGPPPPPKKHLKPSFFFSPTSQKVWDLLYLNRARLSRSVTECTGMIVSTVLRYLCLLYCSFILPLYYSLEAKLYFLPHYI